MKDERTPLSRAEVDQLLEPGDTVHTFRQAGPVLLGCDWPRADLLNLAESGGAELAGEAATAMNHGVVVWDGNDGLFCATVATTPAAPEPPPATDPTPQPVCPYCGAVRTGGRERLNGGRLLKCKACKALYLCRQVITYTTEKREEQDGN